MELQMHIIGHIGQDANANQVNGKTVLNFSVAHSEKWTNAQGQPMEKTTWVDCSMWERENLAPYLKAGTLVSLHGTPEAVPYATKQGELRATLKCSVLRLKLLSAAKT
jgi:single-strand DNA-binding protein